MIIPHVRAQKTAGLEKPLLCFSQALLRGRRRLWKESSSSCDNKEGGNVCMEALASKTATGDFHINIYLHSLGILFFLFASIYSVPSYFYSNNTLLCPFVVFHFFAKSLK